MDYKEINRKAWNKLAEIHFDSEFYDNESFIKGRSSLNSIELDILGDLSGQRILHLQCHFGQDSISLQRMGAEVTGVDLSDVAIQKARALAEKTGADTRFICSDIYDLPNVLDEKFDWVFTSYGVIGWLPDMKKWAETVSHFLVPGGKLLLVEFHPVVWMFDDQFSKIEYGYFNHGPIIETSEGSYTDREADVSNENVSWNHGLSEVVGSLLDQKFLISQLKEYNYSPYDCFKGTEEFEKGRFRIKNMGDKLPMTYSLLAEKQ